MKDWTAILPLVGVGVGWLLNQAAARRTERLADRRVIKESLYLLLELRNLLSMLVAVEANLPALVVLMRKQVPLQPPAEFEAAIDELFIKILRDTFLSVTGQQLAGLQESYASCLVKLSAVDPLSAYRLRGVEGILQLAPQLTEALQVAGTAHLDEMTTPPAELLQFVRQEFEPEGIAHSRETITEVMQELVAQLDRRTRRGVTVELARPVPSVEDLAERIEAVMPKVLASLPGMMG